MSATHYLRRMFAFGSKRTLRYRVLTEVEIPRVLILDQCLSVLQRFFAPTVKCQHEGIVYLYGKTDGYETIALGVYRPEARTTPGSFHVSPLAMAKVVETVCDLGLQVIGQIHSHPTVAEHSRGDEEGTRIAYDGFVSIVLPKYAADLPSLAGAAVYMFRQGQFNELCHSSVSIIPGGME